MRRLGRVGDMCLWTNRWVFTNGLSFVWWVLGEGLLDL